VNALKIFQLIPQLTGLIKQRDEPHSNWAIFESPSQVNFVINPVGSHSGRRADNQADGRTAKLFHDFAPPLFPTFKMSIIPDCLLIPKCVLQIVRKLVNEWQVRTAMTDKDAWLY